MKSIIEFIAEKQNFLIKGHTKNQKSFEVYRYNTQCFVKVNTVEDAELLYNAMINDYKNTFGNKSIENHREGTFKMLQKHFDQGDIVFWSYMKQKKQFEVHGLCKATCSDKSNLTKEGFIFIKTINIKDFTWEYFNNQRNFL